MTDWKPIGRLEGDKVLIDDCDFLKAFMGFVFQRTVGPDPSSWLNDNVDKNQYFDKWPGGTVFQDHWDPNRKSGAIDGTIKNAVNKFVLIAFNGDARKFTARDTSRKLVKFFGVVCAPIENESHLQDGALTRAPRNYGNELDFHDDTDESVIDAKKAALLKVVNNVFDRAMSDSMKSGIVDTACVPDFLSDAAELLRNQMRPTADSISDECIRYNELFYEDLFLEGMRVNRATVDRVFIEPNFSVLKDSILKGDTYHDFFNLLRNFFAGHISDSISTLSNRVSALTVLGQPGSGKTTLMSAVVARKMNYGLLPDGMSLYCVRLSKLAGTDFIQSTQPMHYIRTSMGLDANAFNNAAIILDGLDELCMVLAAGATIDGFFESLLEDVKSFENCKLVVTSRLNYVQGVFSKPNLTHIIELQTLDKYQVVEFAQNLEKCRGVQLRKSLVSAVIDKSIEYGFLTIPLLLYMTLTLELDVETAEELGDLYDQIFNAMSERPYGDNRKHKAAERFDPRAIARALAVEMRRLNRGYLDAEEAEDVLCQIDFPFDSDDDDYKRTLKIIEKSYGLTFFYRSRDLASFAPEFYHRSFAEYLAAEQIFIELSKSVKEGDNGVWSWWERMEYLLGGEELQDSVLNHFSHIVRKSGQADEFVKYMSKWLFDTYLDYGMISGDGAHDNLYDPVTKGLLLFLNYWHLLKSLRPNASVTQFKPSEDYQSFASMLRLASRVKQGSICLDYEELVCCNFQDIDFSECSLVGTNLYKTDLSHCNFYEANLTGANLTKTLLYFTDFNNANLRDATLETTDVYFCNLKDAKNIDSKKAEKIIKASTIFKNSVQP